MFNTACEEIEVKALDERIIVRLFETKGDEKAVAAIGLDVDVAQDLIKTLKAEIKKAKSSKYYNAD